MRSCLSQRNQFIDVYSIIFPKRPKAMDWTVTLGASSWTLPPSMVCWGFSMCMALHLQMSTDCSQERSLHFENPILAFLHIQLRRIVLDCKNLQRFRLKDWECVQIMEFIANSIMVYLHVQIILMLGQWAFLIFRMKLILFWPASISPYRCWVSWVWALISCTGTRWIIFPVWGGWVQRDQDICDRRCPSGCACGAGHLLFRREVLRSMLVSDFSSFISIL